MRLPHGGLDIFYVDESMDQDTFVMCSVAIPFLRKEADGNWTVAWEDYFEKVRQWRTAARHVLDIPVRKELKGQKLASGRGRYKHGKQQLSRAEGVDAYHQLLSALNFLPDKSIIGIAGSKASKLYDATRLEALLVALLQRMRTACLKTSRLGMVFFDEGHGEYRTQYRKAKRYLPTGSMMGGWSSGGMTKNLPMDNFTKDANTKQSQHSWMIQIADIAAYALLLKIRGERGTLTPWQVALGAGTLYDSIPGQVLNKSASFSDPLGIVRL